jgi:hypothetical protein
MKIKQITEAVHRAQTTEHLINRINVAAKLCDSMGDYPLLFRDFQTNDPGYTVLAKITNSHRGTNIKAGQAGRAQTEILEQLGIEHPVFTKMIKPNSNRGPFGDSHIFLPPKGAPAYWSPKVKDIGGQELAEDVEAWRGKQAIELAKTYQKGLPSNYTTHEIIFDCGQYYLINIQSFLKDFAGQANKEFIEKNKYTNVPLKIDPAIFDTHITNYSHLSWYLRNTAIDFLNDYQDKVAEFKKKYPNYN